MTGYLVALVLGLVVFGALALLGLPRAIWSFAGAVMMLGGAGYVLQGAPGLAAAAPRPLPPAADPASPEMVALRERLLGRFTEDAAYITASEAMLRIGEERAAVTVLLGGLSKLPRSFILWTALGGAMAAHDGDQVSPPATLAFARAARLAPEHPAPPFYAGLAYVRAGEFATARRYWARALALSPEGASYRVDIAARLALLDRYLVLVEAGQVPQPR